MMGCEGSSTHTQKHTTNPSFHTPSRAQHSRRRRAHTLASLLLLLCTHHHMPLPGRPSPIASLPGPHRRMTRAAGAGSHQHPGAAAQQEGSRVRRGRVQRPAAPHEPLGAVRPQRVDDMRRVVPVAVAARQRQPALRQVRPASWGRAQNAWVGRRGPVQVAAGAGHRRRGAAACGPVLGGRHRTELGRRCGPGRVVFLGVLLGLWGVGARRVCARRRARVPSASTMRARTAAAVWCTAMRRATAVRRGSRSDGTTGARALACARAAHRGPTTGSACNRAASSCAARAGRSAALAGVLARAPAARARPRPPAPAAPAARAALGPSTPLCDALTALLIIITLRDPSCF
mmetsp:Transcript_8907/g.22028  ORF Transcript_8907/g.22028 Transcript_8907/m.22028 type:complete len:346 (+) Transcript_8907:502-1539(+)